MLLIDGVRYEEWVPQTEDEFEREVKKHTLDIFGEQSIYIDRKQMLKSISGIGSKPDGFAIVLGPSQQWHIVEMELSSHDVYGHIVPQVTKFITGIDNSGTRNDVREAIYDEVTKDYLLNLRLTNSIGPTDPHKFLSDLISKPPILTIIIEKTTKELEDVKKTLAFLQIKVVEFQTFVREKVGLAVHAHLFEPLVIEPPKIVEEPPPDKEGKGRKVTFEELAKAGLIKDGQVLYFYNTRPFTNERAQVMVPSNQLKYEGDGRMYSKSELAKQLLIKHGFKHDEHGVAGPKYWKTEDGKFLRGLEEQVRSLRGDRG